MVVLHQHIAAVKSGSENKIKKEREVELVREKEKERGQYSSSMYNICCNWRENISLLEKFIIEYIRGLTFLKNIVTVE